VDFAWSSQVGLKISGGEIKAGLIDVLLRISVRVRFHLQCRLTPPLLRTQPS
jgi:hypothetical protein